MGKSVLECDCDIIHKEQVDKAKKSLICDDLLLNMSDFYKAFSDSTRIKIINLLKDNSLCVCDISSILNLTKSTVSHQLKNLRELNLIKYEKKGKEVWYSLADEHVKLIFEICYEHIMEQCND